MYFENFTIFQRAFYSHNRFADIGKEGEGEGRGCTEKLIAEFGNRMVQYLCSFRSFWTS